MAVGELAVRTSRIAFSLGVTLLLSGCGHSVEHALSGRWFGESVESFDPADVAAATGWARGASMEFSGDVVTVAIPAEDPRKGHYEVASARESEVVLAIRDDHGHSENARFTLDGDHYLKWHIDERRSVVLRREQ